MDVPLRRAGGAWDGAISAEVRGINKRLDKLPVLTRVEVAYRLRVPAANRDVVDRALASHGEKCPTAASLRGAVDVVWTAGIEKI